MGNADIAIRAEGVGKKYFLRHATANGRYQTFREALTSRVQFLGHRLLGNGDGASLSREAFWALRDVSFQVQRGEVVGFIGRNGAGKSTLLKILSRITNPTTGRVEIDGRVASLLEVGTGFHPELSGRENIFLNGAILGMSRAEVRRKFAEIVAFAEIEKFLDTPVKRYSSGMYVRLAFAIAAHLESEILIIDEVLAVGDHAFRERCLGRMQRVTDEGRTVIFVSHHFGHLRQICRRGLILTQGQLTYSGDIDDCITQYLRTLSEKSDIEAELRTDRIGSGRSRLRRVRVVDSQSGSSHLTAGKSADFEFEVTEGLPSLVLAFTIYSQSGQPVCTFEVSEPWSGPREEAKSAVHVRCHLPSVLLLPGSYRLNVGMRAGAEMVDHLEAAATFEVADGLMDGNVIKMNRFAVFYQPHQWEVCR